MNKKSYIGLPLLGLAMAAMMQSCVSDQPFGMEGEGTLQMKMVINSDVTRAETDEDALRSNCVVYISGTKGLLYKYKGLENVPDALVLKSGNYVAEAWTGDSVSASFDKKFFRGYQPFTIQPGNNPVVVNCKIANVVVSINPATIDASLMKDWKINVANSRAGLDFTADNMDYAKGYFMMPNADTHLTYTVTGTNAEGTPFTKTGTIENPQRAHEYVLNVEYHPDYEEIGGSFITITVDDSEVLVEDEVPLFSRPAVKGVDFDITKQLIGNAGAFKQQVAKVTAFGGIRQMHLLSPDYAAFGLPSNDIDLINMTAAVGEQVKEAGLQWDLSFNEKRNLAISYLTFTPAILNRLAERNEEYQLTIAVTDAYGKTTEQPMRVAVGEGAIVIEDPVTITDATASGNLLDIRSTRAVLHGNIVSADALNPGIRYREAGTTQWTVVLPDAGTRSRAARRHLTPAQALRSGGTPFSITLTGLKPATRYEYQGVADEFASESKYFTTEDTFTIPNAGMEEWGSVTEKGKNVIIPSASAGGFWDSGNHGSATMNVTLTQSSSDMIHGGSLAARLRSQFVGLGSIGKHAAGNLFTGDFTLDGMDGILTLGRTYGGSHPDKLAVWANYRPAEVGKKNLPSSADDQKLKQGDMDHGQIYVALTTQPVTVKTKKADRQLFNPESSDVVAYGEVTWAGTGFGPDGALERLEIPLTYKDAAKTQKPLYIIIVCTASKFGDYFVGGEGSLLYLDDFELVY